MVEFGELQLQLEQVIEGVELGFRLYNNLNSVTGLELKLW